MAYTTRSDARQYECPACGAPEGEKCRGARGRPRESVHRERWNAAANGLEHPDIRTLTLDGSRLVDQYGNVIGQVTHLEMDLQSEVLAGNLRRGEGEAVVDVGVVDVELSQTQEPSLSQRGAGGSQESMLPDPVAETWELYAKLLERPRVKLTPQVRKFIANAHKAVGVEQTNQAIRGLAASEYHRQNGYVGIEYALVPKRGETIEGRIAMMSAKATDPQSGNERTTVQRLIGRLPSEVQPMVRNWVTGVEDMLRNPTNVALQQTGQGRLKDLRDKAHMEPVIEDGRIIDWKDLR